MFELTLQLLTMEGVRNHIISLIYVSLMFICSSYNWDIHFETMNSSGMPVVIVCFRLPCADLGFYQEGASF